MTYTVKYRDKTGSTVELELDVPNKSAVWAELKKRGISALSVREGAAKNRRPSGGKSPSSLRGVLAGLCVVALAVGAWFFFKDEQKPAVPEKTPTTKLVKEVTPAKPKPPKPAEVEKPKEPVKVAPAKPKKQLETYVDEHGVERYKGGLRVQKGESEVTIDMGKNQKPDIFKNYAESRIAFLLTIEPGEMIFGDYDYNHPRFKQELQNALINKIEITDEDSEEDQKLKQAVTDVKKELLAALKRGEDISEILSETQKEMQRLGEFQREMENHVREAVKDGSFSNEDIEDYVAAANKMLAEKGIAPLKLNCVSKRALKLRKEKLQ